MEKTDCQIKCMDCGKWISSPVVFGNSQSFFNSTLVGNKLKCPFCGEDTDCNKKNMRFISRLKDSGFMVTYYQEKTTFDDLEN